MCKKVLVTGANGFIGSNLIGTLKDSNWQVYPAVRYDAQLEDEIIIDLEDPLLCKSIEKLPKVDALVHLGARIGWDGSPIKELFRPNVIATSELAKWAARIDAHFVFISAAIVCGKNNTNITANTTNCPDTDYGLSKLLAENMVKDSGARNTILRCSGIFGKNGPEHLGINKAIKYALKGKSPIQYGAGSGKRNYLYVKDLSMIIKYCIENEIQGIHLSAGSEINTISEMLSIICNVILPNKTPELKLGDKGYDQIIERSEMLSSGRKFVDSIKDILTDET